MMWSIKQGAQYAAVCLLVMIAIAAPARADFVYSYTGRPFTGSSGSFACPPVCQVTGSFTVAARLPANLGFWANGATSYSLSNGLFTLTNADNPLGGLLITTDGNGNINQWDWVLFAPHAGPGELILTDNGLGGAQPEDVNGQPIGGIVGVIDDTHFSCCGPDPHSEAYNEFSPGVWTVRDTSVPEPASLTLLAAGMLAIALARRRRWAPGSGQQI